MRVVIEVGDWEHECCGPAFERDSTAEVSCLERPTTDQRVSRYVDSHHDVDPGRTPVVIRGRVVDISIVHPDGSTEAVRRLPSGRALRGFDDDDDGHLEQPWNGQPVVKDSDQFLLTILT